MKIIFLILLIALLFAMYRHLLIRFRERIKINDRIGSFRVAHVSKRVVLLVNGDKALYCPKERIYFTGPKKTKGTR